MQRKNKLVVLDIDDLLIKRIRHSSKPEDVHKLSEEFSKLLINPVPSPQIHRFDKFSMMIRPDLGDFLERLFREYHVGIWTSSTYPNAKLVVETILTPEQRKDLVLFWCRDRAVLDPDYDPDDPDPVSTLTKYSTIKPIDRILESASLNENRKWTYDNVLIIDNSLLKLRMNPAKSSLVWPNFEAPISQIFDVPFFQS